MPNEELKAVQEELKRIGAALGLSVREDERAAGFARRCTEAARQLRASAGITWPDYELIKVDGKRVWFGLKVPPENQPLGGPRWPMDLGQGLEQLAVQLGTYEGA